MATGHRSKNTQTRQPILLATHLVVGFLEPEVIKFRVLPNFGATDNVITLELHQSFATRSYYSIVLIGGIAEHGKGI